ncbi:MAG: hypothetical protein Q8Q52_06250 [Acidimicrobiia bacterium]|jgi:hypothetical protein|nr:hypothetical protein [Acidimicrobiia bacterium]
MRRTLLVLAMVISLMGLAAAPAMAHVHGVTPLSGCTVDNANSGGLRTNGTPAADANGGPIVGVIPFGTGNSPLGFGDGGFGAATGHCP